MQVYLVIALIIAILAVIFAVQNVAAVSITFFTWNAQISLAIALLASVCAGVLITLLLSVPGRIKGSWNNATNKKKFSSLEAERDDLKSKVDEITSDRDMQLKNLEASKQEIANMEAQLASMSAALQESETKHNQMTSPALPTPDILPPAGESATR